AVGACSPVRWAGSRAMWRLRHQRLQTAVPGRPGRRTSGSDACGSPPAITRSKSVSTPHPVGRWVGRRRFRSTSKPASTRSSAFEACSKGELMLTMRSLLAGAVLVGIAIEGAALAAPPAWVDGKDPRYARNEFVIGVGKGPSKAASAIDARAEVQRTSEA